MPPVDEWASDASYPPATSVGVDQSTKIEPSSGAKAQGFIPGQKMTAQRLNWILNALCVLGNGTEADLDALALVVDEEVAALQAQLDARSLQVAWERSVALGQTTHIHFGDGGGTLDRFRIGDSGRVIFEVDSEMDTVTAYRLQVLANASVENLQVSAANQLSITGGGPGGVPHALIQTSGVGGQVPLQSGTWTPDVSAVTGTGVSAGDFTNIAGNYIRVGKTFHFSLDFQVDTTGWGSSGTVSFTLPEAGTVDGYVRGTVSMVEVMDGKFSALSLARSASPTAIQLQWVLTGTYASYISVSGTLTLQ